MQYFLEKKCTINMFCFLTDDHYSCDKSKVVFTIKLLAGIQTVKTNGNKRKNNTKKQSLYNK